MGKYYEAKEGEWIKPARNGYKACCCDCGLVHKIDFRIKNKRIEFRVFRDNRATGQVRRHMNKEKRSKIIDPDCYGLMFDD